MIVITTPTGRIGHQVLEQLLSGDEPVRVIVRDRTRLRPEAQERADILEGSHGDTAVIDRACEGADAVFWLAPPNPAAASLQDIYAGFTRPAIQAFQDRGVTHVVGVSALGRGTPMADRAGLVTASLAMDDLIASSGVAYRALALPSFIDNLLGQASVISAHGMFSSTVAADLKAPTCTTADIAGAAVRLLSDRSWSGHGEVPVLGPEDLSQNDMARILSEVLGRPIRYERATLDALRAMMRQRGASEAMAEGIVDMMRAKDEGLDNAIARTPATSSPTTFRAWCEHELRPAIEG